MYLHQEDFLLNSFLKKYTKLGRKNYSSKDQNQKIETPDKFKSRWTQEQLDILVRLYPEHSNFYIAKILNKTKSGIDSKASLLQLKKSIKHRKAISQKNGKNKHHCWTNEEMEYLKQNFKLKTYIEIANNLSRTPSSIFQKARQLLLKKYKVLKK